MPHQETWASFGDIVSLIRVFPIPTCNFEDFQILETMCFGEGVTVSQETIWGKRPQGVIAVKWTLVFVQSLVPYNCPLKAECRAGTKMLPRFFVASEKGYLYWHNPLLFNLEKYATFHFHADHRTICSFLLDLITGGLWLGHTKGANLPLVLTA